MTEDDIAKAKVLAVDAVILGAQIRAHLHAAEQAADRAKLPLLAAQIRSARRQIPLSLSAERLIRAIGGDLEALEYARPGDVAHISADPIGVLEGVRGEE